MVLHQLIDELEKDLNLTPEQKFRITAKIKRLIHYEKENVYFRYYLYSRGPGIYEGPEDDRVKIGEEPPKDPWLSNILKEASENHKNLAALPDEKLVTWSVGSHVYKQE